jgi:hypothetical protein
MDACEVGGRCVTRRSVPEADDRNLEWLTLRSSLTPMAAAGIVTTIANALYQSFALPKAECGLGLSFLLAAIMLFQPGRLLARLLLWPLNALLIFAVFVGANSIGSRVGAGGEQVIARAAPAAIVAPAPPPPPGAPASTPAPALGSPVPPPILVPRAFAPAFRVTLEGDDKPTTYEWHGTTRGPAAVPPALSDIADKDVALVVRSRDRRFFDPVF